METVVSKVLGEKIKFLKEHFGLTNKELGHKYGVSAQAINFIINEKTEAPAKLIYAFLKMGVNLNLLLDNSISSEEFRTKWSYTELMKTVISYREQITKQDLIIQGLIKKA